MIAAFGSFSPAVRLLLINQFGINVGFYMLVPYLADHLSGQLGLAVWLTGLLLGLRNLSQQGMFLLGGTLCDRYGYKRLIMAGCGLRTIGFALFAVSTSVPALIVASVLTGLAGALFNPAVRAYISVEATERKVEAFALFNVFYQAGILTGPLAGVLLISVDFRLTCLAAAAVFAALTALQACWLPERHGTTASSTRPVLADWQEVATNRPFVTFSAAMFASYALSYQIYLALPLELHRLGHGQASIAVMYTLTALLAVAGQVRLTSFAKARWQPEQAITRGLAVMGIAFLPALLAAQFPHMPCRTAVMTTAVLVSAMVLTAGGMLVFPFEMAMIATLGRQELTGTYYGLYNAFSGLGILLGNLASGWAMDHVRGAPALPWLLLVATGFASAVTIRRLDRTGRLRTRPAPA
ncbi:MFS transporter [Microbispora sp. H10836]|uniref:MDR family MFS transporter n=1 Tax=Microbispora sp. H10836 TaxID=2729106 RepID=UPI001472AA2E|nr:MFS transporter [Microbispora sp. H10836]